MQNEKERLKFIKEECKKGNFMTALCIQEENNWLRVKESKKEPVEGSNH